MDRGHRRATVAIVAGVCGVLAAVPLLAPGCEAPGPMLAGPGDDDGEATTCTPALCHAGSAVCCPGGSRGRWDTMRLGCICPTAADADADAPDVPGCRLETCMSICISLGHSFGRCSAEVCICEDWTADADVDADADRHVDRYCPPAHAPELGGTCNVVLQCGCPTGERCWIDFSGAAPIEACIPTGGDPPGGPCSAGDNCVAGSQCFGFAADDARCMRFCYEDGDCPSGQSCLIDITDVSGYRLCDVAVDCDPFAAAGCPAGETCIVLPFDGTTLCMAAGTALPGDECTALGECVVGSGCYSSPGDPAYLCHAYCDMAGTAHPCPAGLTCAAALGHASIGLCLAD